MEDKSKISIKIRKCIFWQTSMNDQRLKLRMNVNGVETVADVSIITPE